MVPQKMLDELVRSQLAYHCAMIEQLEGAARKVASIDPDAGADVRCTRLALGARVHQCAWPTSGARVPTHDSPIFCPAQLLTATLEQHA